MEYVYNVVYEDFVGDNVVKITVFAKDDSIAQAKLYKILSNGIIHYYDIKSIKLHERKEI